jgi:hypothetical protein
MDTSRAVLTIVCYDGEWVVELEGEVFGRSRERDVAKAAANRRVLELQAAGRPCQVRVVGESGFFILS